MGWSPCFFLYPLLSLPMAISLVSPLNPSPRTCATPSLMAFATHRPRKPTMLSSTSLFSLLLLSLFLLILLRYPSLPPCSPPATSRETHPWSGDLREVGFSWNSLKLTGHRSLPATLRIAVFSRKWPVASSPGGMERHALTLHSALALRGHDVHVFTSSPPPTERPPSQRSDFPQLHFLSGPPGLWRCDEAWTLYEAEAQTGGPFDVIHSESVAVFHRWARDIPNLVVSWHGISLEALHSGIYQDLARAPDEPMTPAFNNSLAQAIYRVLNEIRFFQS